MDVETTVAGAPQETVDSEFAQNVVSEEASESTSAQNVDDLSGVQSALALPDNEVSVEGVESDNEVSAAIQTMHS